MNRFKEIKDSTSPSFHICLKITLIIVLKKKLRHSMQLHAELKKLSFCF